jgi:hypothetical protein
MTFNCVPPRADAGIIYHDSNAAGQWQAVSLSLDRHGSVWNIFIDR